MMPTHIVAVGGIVRDGAGRVLIAKSKRHGFWEFLGGQVGNGENLEEALVREIKEESGIEARVVCLAGIYSNVQSYTDPKLGFVPTKLMLDFICEYISGTPTDSNETESVKWVSPDEALDLISADSYGIRLGNMLDYDGHVGYVAYETRPFVERHRRIL